MGTTYKPLVFNFMGMTCAWGWTDCLATMVTFHHAYVAVRRSLTRMHSIQLLKMFCLIAKFAQKYFITSMYFI